MPAQRTSRQRPFLRGFLPAFVLLSLLSSLWSLATPIFASPDENAHAAKAIAQVRGQTLGEHREGVRFPVYELPDEYRYSPQIVCFAFEPEAHAACGVELGADEGTDWFASWVSSYNPAYYYVVGAATLVLDGSAGVYGMRVVSGLLGSGLLALAVAAAFAATARRWMPLGVAFLASPMVLFLNGSVNPQGMEFSAGVLLLIAVLRLVEKLRTPQDVALSLRAVWVLVVAGALFLAIGRAIGPVWVVLIVVGALSAAGWRESVEVFRRRGSYLPMGIVAIGGVLALAWTAYTGIFASQAAEADAPLVGAGFLAGAWSMIRLTPQYIQAAAGHFGWLDTVLPSTVYGLFYGALAVLFTLAVVAPSRRDRLAVAVAAAAALLVPVVIQAAQVDRTGIIWQGRYSMVLYLAVVLLAAWALSRSGERVASISVGTTAIVTGALTAYGIAAFVIVLHRYVVGAGGSYADMVNVPIWQPPGGWPALVAAFAVVLVAWNAWIFVAARRASVTA